MGNLNSSVQAAVISTSAACIALIVIVGIVLLRRKCKKREQMKKPSSLSPSISASPAKMHPETSRTADSTALGFSGHQVPSDLQNGDNSTNNLKGNGPNDEPKKAEDKGNEDSNHSRNHVDKSSADLQNQSMEIALDPDQEHNNKAARETHSFFDFSSMNYYQTRLRTLNNLVHLEKPSRINMLKSGQKNTKSQQKVLGPKL